MTTNNRIVISSDHAAVRLREVVAAHVAAHGWVVVDTGPTTAENASYPEQGAAAARLVATGNCRFGIVLCGTGRGIMMVANEFQVNDP